MLNLICNYEMVLVCDGDVLHFTSFCVFDTLSDGQHFDIKLQKYSIFAFQFIFYTVFCLWLKTISRRAARRMIVLYPQK